MTELFNRTREFVKESFKNEAQMLHFDRTVYWLQYLKPDADEAFLIAAIGHDIERAFRPARAEVGNTRKSFLDEDHLTVHQEGGARILGDLLTRNSASEEMVEKVKHLVFKHEVGGDTDQNLLMDADSLSFVENNAQIFLSKIENLG